MVKFTECLSEQLIPYIQYCIHTIFPPAQIAMHLGISVGVLQKEVRDHKVKVHKRITNLIISDYLQEITYLNKQAILEPVAILLPIKKDSLVSKLAASNVQSLMSHNTTLLVTTASVPLTEAAVSSTKTTEESKDKVTQHATVSKHDVQNPQDSSNNIN